MVSSSGRRLALVVGACAASGLAVWAYQRASGRAEARDAPGGGGEAAASAGNDPITLRLNGREVHVRCELSCAPLDAELARLYAGCQADPLRAPHLVSAGGVSLAALGCCTEAEEAYRQACGFDGELSRCGTEWAARCARGGT